MIAMPTIINITDINCATRIPSVNIRLSVLIPSTKNRPIEYQIRYRQNVSPTLKCLRNTINTMKPKISHTDQYKNVEWKYLPSIYMLLIIKSGICKFSKNVRDTGPPCASWFTKFPHLPIP